MPTGIYKRSLVRIKVKDGLTLIDITEAARILELSTTRVHLLCKEGAIKPLGFESHRWWLLKSDIVLLKSERREKKERRAKESKEYHKLKMREWHRKMTAERRCHWCGKPSCKDYVDACEEHLELARGTNSYLKEQQREKRMAKRLCTECGKRPARFGFTACALCGAIKAAYNRRKREQRRDCFFGYIAESSLIDVDEVALILGCHRVSVHNLIDRGILQVKYKGRRRFWLAENEVLSYRKVKGGELSGTSL